MDKNVGKEHEKFYNSFIKYSIITTIAIIVLLVLLYFFLI